MRATILLLSWRDAAFIDAALDAALAQTVPCQIVVSNDAATDGCWERIQSRLQGYRGPHEVELRRNARNLGVVGHLNAAFAAVRGDVVVMMAGDDIAQPQRVARIMEAFAGEATLMAVGSGFQAIDVDGRQVDADYRNWRDRFDLHALAHAGKFPTLLGAALAYRREVFDHFGPLHGVVEDNALTLRAALLGQCRNLPDVLLSYRQHAASVSSGVFAKHEDRAQQRRLRYQRTAKFYAGTAEDFAHCLGVLGQRLQGQRLEDARRLLRMYRAEAGMRAALAQPALGPRLQALRTGLRTAGLRRKSLEYAGKLWVTR